MIKLLAPVRHWNLFRAVGSRRLRRQSLLSANVVRSINAVETLEDRSLLSAFSVQQAVVRQVNTAATPLVAYGSTWKYLDNGTDQGTAWRAAGFNDSAWASGPSKLGYGDANATTVGYGPSSTNKYVTTYFRQSFNIANPGSVTTLDLGVVRDDGVAVYLNGVEIVRNNLAAGALFNTLAPSPAIDGVNETTPQTSSVSVASLPVGTLVAGTNVLAAEIHQQSVTSSDIGFNFQMTSSGTAMEVVVDFNQAFNASTLAASDLLIDGAATASSVIVIDADTAKFQLSALAVGSHTLSLPAGSVLATDASPLDVFSQSVSVASVPQCSIDHDRSWLRDSVRVPRASATSGRDRQRVHRHVSHSQSREAVRRAVIGVLLNQLQRSAGGDLAEDIQQLSLNLRDRLIARHDEVDAAGDVRDLLH